MSPTPPDDASKCPLVGDDRYDMSIPGSSKIFKGVTTTKIFVFFLAGVLTITSTGLMYAAASTPFEVESFLTITVLGLLFSSFGTVATILRSPNRTELYSWSDVGSYEVTCREYNRAGIPLETTRVLSDDDMIQCHNCGSETSEAIRVKSASDFVLFGFVVETISQTEWNYCNECVDVNMGNDELMPIKPK